MYKSIYETNPSDTTALDLPGARFAHLATHGFFERGKDNVLHLNREDMERGLFGERRGAAVRNPLLLCGLVLAGANRRAPDRPQTWAEDGGILTAEDLIGLNLQGMELAVLSACETGLGDVAAGEGVFGLQRALHVAGARNVIASLWSVGDESTAALMGLFYHHLWQEKKPPLFALREAQLYLYHHPEQIPALAQNRAPKLDVVSKIEGATPLEKVEPAPAAAPSGKAAVKQWAGFVLSGTGR